MKKQRAIKYFGSATKLAKALGIKSAAVSQWGELIPELRAFQLERLTDGKLKVCTTYKSKRRANIKQKEIA
ncbi:Cro/CI family transcriptional regulator [Hahella sp. HN01]|uniref:Cro/CI family transcriptional regulator n=1 Tax=Hahella sp. HN01 TaxID=2847262 RepID=UPI001C1EF613|nr:Cro/Cl family transcriptional regulator [Hahella sp. HN01]